MLILSYNESPFINVDLESSWWDGKASVLVIRTAARIFRKIKQNGCKTPSRRCTSEATHCCSKQHWIWRADNRHSSSSRKWANQEETFAPQQKKDRNVIIITFREEGVTFPMLPKLFIDHSNDIFRNDWLDLIRKFENVHFDKKKVLVRKAHIDSSVQKVLCTSMRAEKIHQAHQNTLTGNTNVSRVYDMLWREFYWKYMITNVY